MKLNFPTAWLIACPAVPLTILGCAWWTYQTVQAEHYDAVRRIAAINAKPETRYLALDPKGMPRHNLCSGGGWCISDRIPPKSNAARIPQPAHRASGVPTIDAAALEAAIKPTD